MARAKFQAYDAWILDGAVVTSDVAPAASYSLDTLLSLRPSTRVRFEVDTVTITFTLDDPAEVDLFALPMSNLSGAVLTLTNGSGLSRAITLAAVRRNGIPYTTIVDLSIATPSAVTRTSDVWNLEIAGNAADVILGGCVWLGSPLEALGHNYSWGSRGRAKHGTTSIENDYLAEYVTNKRTFRQEFELNLASATDADRAIVLGWNHANFGRGYPSVLWMDPDINDGTFGRWQEEYEEAYVFLDNTEIPIVWREASKGKPL